MVCVHREIIGLSPKCCGVKFMKIIFQKIFIKFVWVGSLALVLTASAVAASHENTLQRWVGASSDQLVSAWGPPSSEYNLNNGGKVLEYVKVNNVAVSGYTYKQPVTTFQNGAVSAYGNNGSVQGNYNGTSTTYVQRQTPSLNITMWCKTRFTVDSKGKIINFAWEGNACKQR